MFAKLADVAKARFGVVEEGAPDTVPWSLDAALAGPVEDTTCFMYRTSKMRFCSAT